MTFKNGTFYKIESLQIVSDLSFEIVIITPFWKFGKIAYIPLIHFKKIFIPDVSLKL